MDKIEQQLQLQLQDIYRQSIDADEFLKGVREQGGAKFAQIFPENTVFDTQANLFKPYITETAAVFQLWQEDRENEEKLQALMQRLQLLLETLAALKQLRQMA